jgi:hypothetical protein
VKDPWGQVFLQYLLFDCTPLEELPFSVAWPPCFSIQYSLLTEYLSVQVALLGVSNINVQDGEGSSALHIATEGKKLNFR